MSSSGRRHPPPLIAARSTDKASESGGSGDGSHTPTPMDSPQPAPKAKRTLVESACSACRRRKSRCDGVRPTCSRCQTLRTDCQYEAEEGESRWSALRRRNQLLETEKNELRELFRYVQTRPEPEALEIFRLIRLGGYEDAFALLKQIRDRDGIISPGYTPPNLHRSSSSSASGEQRLPPIRAMLEVTTGPPPITVVASAAGLSHNPLPLPITTTPPDFARAQSMGSMSNPSRGSRSSAELAWSPTSPA